MKITILFVVFVVSAFGVSEAAEPIIDYYRSIYNDSYIYIAWTIGSLLRR